MTPFARLCRVTSTYGYREYRYNGKLIKEFHYGQDIVPTDFPGQVLPEKDWYLQAIWDAIKVEYLAGWNGGRGNMLILYYSNTLRVIYQHLKSALPTNGGVKQGQLVAITGSTGQSTGAHLHIEVQVLKSGKWTPVNPAQYTEVPNTVGVHPANSNLDKKTPDPAPEPPAKLPTYMVEIGPASSGDMAYIKGEAEKLGLPVEVKEVKE